MARRETSPLIDAIWEAYDCVLEAQKRAVTVGNSEALETLAIAREWLRFTLRRLGTPAVRGEP